MTSTQRKIIPIIGIISSGKSTFLQALIQSDILESGGTTTTKFPCLIKNKNSGPFQFYHVKICENKEERFIKDGEIISGEENIKNKIKEINKSEEKNMNNLFYILECPIDFIENKKLLEENYFMDVPGLNETKFNYVENIFEKIKDIINFYIFIFNIENYVGDETKNIFHDLEINGYLQKKENNLFLLNKINIINSGTIETRIEEFSNYFYKTFEKEDLKINFEKEDLTINNNNTFEKEDLKINNNNTIEKEDLTINNNNTIEKEDLKINKYKNSFIPISSISFKAELSLQNFSSFLIFHLIKISSETNEDDLSFIEKLKTSVDNIFENDEDLEFEIKKIIKKISPEEKEIILSEIEKYNKIKNQICNCTDINSDINMKKREHYETIHKLFYINKKKKFPIQNSNTYIKLKDFFNNQNVVTLDEEAPPSINIKLDNIELLEKLTNFITESISTETFSNIGEESFEIFRNEFQAIKNNLLSEKLRISFIGSISVGKSSIINCLIGEEINPT